MDTKLKGNIYSRSPKIAVVLGMFATVVAVAVIFALYHVEMLYQIMPEQMAVENELALEREDIYWLINTGWAHGTEDIGQYGNYYEDGYRFKVFDYEYVELYDNTVNTDIYVESTMDSPVYYDTQLYPYDIETYVTSERYYSATQRVDYDRSTGMMAIIIALVLIAVFFVLSGIYCKTSGQSFKGDEVKLGPLNRVYNDIIVSAIGIAAFMIIVAIMVVWAQIYDNLIHNYSISVSVEFATLILVVAAMVLVTLWIYLLDCVSKRAKRKEFFRYTLIAKVLGLIKRLCVSLYSFAKSVFFSIADKNVRKWVTGMGVAAVVLNTFWISFMLSGAYYYSFIFWLLTLIGSNTIIIVLVLLAIKHVEEFEVVKKGITEIRSGNTDHKIPPLTSPIVNGVAENINNIGDGIATSVQRAMVSEKMKSDLVTNVSHDLKTPLTSVIGYIDLLSKVENLPGEAIDYIIVLQEKSERLSGIVSDVFDLAKSTSGNAELLIEQLDFKRLVQQTLGDLDEKINDSGLSVKTVFSEDALFIDADGKRLYRVMQNLIDNALKYSLQGTRIFMKLHSDGKKAIFEMSNIAGYDMNFTEQEIMQRFVRGDDSRSTEGNGLGLSIAQSFTELCKGQFEIKVDGDMFKTILRFNLSHRETEEETQEILADF